MIIYIYQGMLASGVATEGKGEVMREEGKSSQKKKLWHPHVVTGPQRSEPIAGPCFQVAFLAERNWALVLEGETDSTLSAHYLEPQICTSSMSCGSLSLKIHCH